jgi:imidazolonepropionase
VPVAVGSDLNPGSSPLYATSLALALSLRLNGLRPAEALVAGTVNAAAALGLDDVGWLGAGARADLVVVPDRRLAGAAGRASAGRDRSRCGRRAGRPAPARSPDEAAA